jgi:hypothetical protein
MFQSKSDPNKKFGSVFRQRKYDEVHAPKKNEADELESAEQNHEGVKEHGPAHTVHIEHKNNKHTVKSLHDDGHEENTEHETAEEAHEEGKRRAMEAAEESPEQALPEIE